MHPTIAAWPPAASRFTSYHELLSAGSVECDLSAPNRKLGDGLFLQCCREVASGYPDITFDSMIVDNTTMQVMVDNILMHSRRRLSVWLNIIYLPATVFVCFFSWCPSPSSLMWWWCPICTGTWWATCAQAWWEGLALCPEPIMVVTMLSLKRWVFGNSWLEGHSVYSVFEG